MAVVRGSREREAGYSSSRCRKETSAVVSRVTGRKNAVANGRTGDKEIKSARLRGRGRSNALKLQSQKPDHIHD